MELQSLSEIGQVYSTLLLGGAVPVLLLLGFVVLASWGKRFGGGDWLAVVLHGVTATIGFWVFWTVWLDGNEMHRDHIWWEWFAIDGKPFTLGIWLDRKSSLMLALVTGITFLVHVFSLAYMAHDEMRHRYWAYLSLFAAAMCGLILSDNLLMMFLFWELVGLASYFLIGFWFKEALPAKASQKAFIINRIADAGFLMALMAMWFTRGHFNWWHLSLYQYSLSDSLIAIGLIIGAIGKSAQLPFQVWLPDAMAGPTPVSSLIHAATMVVAGVYMLIRVSEGFSHDTLKIIAFIGGITALMAAISALTQTDIKRVLAYSTISQLGLMVMGIGVGANDFSFLHLVTHAFFKCGLFLVAGVVIHHQHAAQAQAHAHFDAQDMRLMGGLGRKMPWTFICWLFFAASLAGLPFTSGFLSKDGILFGILDSVWDDGIAIPLLILMGLGTSLLTAFYIARQGILVFLGKNRAAGAGAPSDYLQALPKTPWQMIVPLVLLAFASTWVIFSPTHPLHLELGSSHDQGLSPDLPWIVTGLAAFGIALAAFIYRKGPLPTRGNFFFDLSFKHFFLDDIYSALLVKPFLALSRLFALIDHYVVDGAVRFVSGLILRKGHRPSLSEGADWIDHHLIDPAVNEAIQPHEKHSLSRASAWLDMHFVDRLVRGVANVVMQAGRRAGQTQSGKLQQYILYTLLTLLLLLLIMIFIFTA